MPIKRRVSKTREHQITDEAVEAFVRAEAIWDAGGYEKWEEEGGRRREYLDASSALGRSVGLRPWETSPLDVPENGPPPERWKSPNGISDWQQAQNLRRELIKAARKRRG